jgi:acyl phosphate:glycerol-3-phosphate acyltransferase
MASPLVSASVRLGAAFAIGAIPFSNLVFRLVKKDDLRRTSSGTVSATSVYRLVGAGPFAASMLLDMGKGALAVSLAKRHGPAVTALAAGLAVTGHNWSPFLRGAGGRGVLPGAGALLMADPRGAALLAGGIAVGRLGRNTALGCFAGEILLVPVLSSGRGRNGAMLGWALLGPMVVKRLLGNARPTTGPLWRVYGTRLFFDCDVKPPPRRSATGASQGEPRHASTARRSYVQ